MVRAESPVAIECLRPVSSGALVWRRGGRLSLTIVVKATLALVNEGAARLGSPAELLHAERAPRPGASILADGDLVPYKPRVDVTYVGFAWAPRPVQAITARLAVHGDGEVLERALQVVGERPSATAQPSPFVRMPIVYERAWTGLGGENPLGVPPHSGRIANLFDPADPNRPACFGPISRSFPSRARLLSGIDPRTLESPTRDPGSGVLALDVPQSLPFEYFLSSPSDQRLDLLNGNETILLENLVEGQSRLHTRLPGIKALAKVFGATLPPQGQAIDLIGDTLCIDGVDKTVSVTWRGTIPVPGTESLLRSLSVMTGVEHPGYPMQWPAPSLRSTVDLAPPGKLPGAFAGGMVDEPTPMLAVDDEGSGSTKALSPEDAMKLLAGAKKALPFGGTPPPPAPPPPTDVAPGRTEQTLSPDEASQLARRLAESVAMPSNSAATEPPLRRPKLTGRTHRAAVEAAAEATARAAGAPSPPAPVSPGAVAPPPMVPTAAPFPPAPRPSPGAGGAPPTFGAPVAAGGTGPLPAFGPPKAPANAAQARWSAPDLVVRAPGFDDATTGAIDDEDSSIGSTVAFSPEAAAELIARRAAKAGAAAPPAATPAPIAAPPVAGPPIAGRPIAGPPAAHAGQRSPVDDDPVDSSAGSTVAFSPEAAAELIAKRMAQLGGSAPRPPGGAPPAPPPPAPPPPAPPPPGAPTVTRSNTLVMDVPAGATTPRPPHGRDR